MGKLRAVVLLVIGLLLAPGIAAAEEPLLPVAAKTSAKLVRLWSYGELLTKPSWTFAICHGLKGTQPGDRFHKLAARIRAHAPQANVLMLDWSPTACLNTYGVPLVWQIAGKINAVAEESAALLAECSVDPTRTTLIGESFGIYVQGRVALAAGGVDRILAFNPANELGGYSPLDLRKVAQRSWSFHTYSVFDTTREIAHGDFFLETQEGADEAAQHTHGIAWLDRRLEQGDGSWLTFDKSLPEAKPGAFCGLARLDGRLDDVYINRQRPAPRGEAALEVAAAE